MTDRRRNIAPGYGRAAGLLALLTGVLAMHVLVFASGSMDHAGQAAAQSITASVSSVGESAAMPMATTRDSTTTAASEFRVMSATLAVESRTMPGMNAGNGCDCGDGMVMGGMHACVFILTALTLLLGLALLGRIVGATHDSAHPVHTLLSRRGRPPPWAVPSLAELSILRI